MRGWRQGLARGVASRYTRLVTSTPRSDPSTTTPHDRAPLFILSFRQRDELAVLAGRHGWQVIAARRADAASDRFRNSGARIAVIDARGALQDGLAAAAMLGGAVMERGGALLVLVSRGDTGALAAFLDAGATHFLSSPHSEGEFADSLRFAERHVERLAACLAGEVPVSATAAPLGWRIDARRQVKLTTALAELLGAPDKVDARWLLRRVPRADRAATLAAWRRLRTEGAPTAFAHEFASIGRVVAHVHYDRVANAAVAVVERLGSLAQPDAVVRDALSRVRDAHGARRWLDQQLQQGRSVQVALIALNRFEIVNTAYGRSAGDTVLQAAQRRLEEVAGGLFGRGAVIARMGGSEFLLAVDAAPAQIEQAAAQIAAALARPFVAGGTMIVLGCRIGIAMRPVAGDDAATLLRRAGEALAVARASDSLTIYTAGIDPPGPALDRLAVDLRAAIEGGEIDVLFQPQVAIAQEAIVGVEALARWEHPAFGAIGAEMLFTAAERAGLTIALSDHIQRRALALAAAWPGVMARLRLAINLTAADIGRPGFADIFLDRVDASGFPRARLTVEITETGLIEDLGAAATLLADLRSAGCRVAIDDFGTGYSSLAYLKALPLDYLKIDKKLAQDITGSSRDRIVVRGVIDMARSLGLAVIAEGVETREHLDLLAKEGCQYYQGFLCAAAVDVAGMVALLTA